MPKKFLQNQTITKIVLVLYTIACSAIVFFGVITGVILFLYGGMWDLAQNNQPNWNSIFVWTANICVLSSVIVGWKWYNQKKYHMVQWLLGIMSAIIFTLLYLILTNA